MSSFNSSTKPLANLKPYHTDNKKKVTKREDAADANDRMHIPIGALTSINPRRNGQGSYHSGRYISADERAAGQAEARAQLNEEGLVGHIQSIVSSHPQSNPKLIEKIRDVGSSLPPQDPKNVSIFIDGHQVLVPHESYLAIRQNFTSSDGDFTNKIPKDSPLKAQVVATYSNTQNNSHAEALPILAEV